MPESIPISSEAAKAGLLYAAGLSGPQVRAGEKLTAEHAVKEIRSNKTHDLLQVTVQDKGKKYTATLLLHDNAWSGECTCAAGGDCRHCFAAMLTFIKRHAEVKSAPAPKPAFTPKVSEPETLVEYAEQKLARKLMLSEQKICELVDRLLREYPTRNIPERMMAPLLGPSAEWSWFSHQVWPERPKNSWDAWLYMAGFLQTRNVEWPKFFVAITPQEDVDAIVDRWRRAQEISKWKAWLTRSGGTVRPESHQNPVELRLSIGVDDARLEMRHTQADPWLPVKRANFNDISKEMEDGGHPIADESLLLWMLFRSGSAMEAFLRYSDARARQALDKIFRTASLASKIVGPQGALLERAPEKLKLSVRPPGAKVQNYQVQLVHGDGSALREDPLVLLQGEPVLFVTRSTIYEAPPIATTLPKPHKPSSIPAEVIESEEGMEVLDQSQAELPEALAARVRRWRARLSVSAKLASTKGSDMEHLVVQFFGLWDESGERDHLTYRGWEYDASAPKSQKSPAPLQENEIVVRDRSALASAGRLVSKVGLSWNPKNYWERPVNRSFPEDFSLWLRALPEGVELHLDPVLESLREHPLEATVELDVEPAGMDWFDLRVKLNVPDVEFTKEELQALLSAEGGWVRLGEKGWKRLKMELSEEDDFSLAELGLSASDLTSEEPQRLHAFQLSNQRASRLLPASAADAIRQRASELQARVTPPQPASVTATLRPYQLDGFHFLAYLATNNFGGFLADDMGLGKTIQTLTWLAWLRELPSFSGAPSIVACPKSVMDNWLQEANRFLPGLRVKLWRTGSGDKVSEVVKQYDLMVVNYAQLRLMIDDLGKVSWNAIILDEAQAIKNPSSQTTQCACSLAGNYRVALTGTPIENQLLDLWSIMSFAMPGVLGNRARFSRLYNQKEDPLARRRLAGRVRPFLLRRTKEQVAKDLPPRVEEDLICEMEGKQATLYSAELKRARQALLKLKTSRDLDKARFNILTSLLRLRQICCHPALVDEKSRKAPSAKVEALMDLLEPLMEEGRKVLVFSQFVKALEILETETKARDWKTFVLTGQTEERGALIESFQKYEGAAVFLLSLKASGFGLNLTSASYVVLYDPWWNPAVENQAIDRTHRIGQQSTVFAYRLLIKDSIEEKIRVLQKQKRALADDVLGEEAFAKSLTLDDLRMLLEGDDLTPGAETV